VLLDGVEPDFPSAGHYGVETSVSAMAIAASAGGTGRRLVVNWAVAEASEVTVHELDRVRAIALGLPEVEERISHGALCFFIRRQRPLCYYHDNHRGDGRISLWCPAAAGVQEEMVRAHPRRFFKPPASASGVFSEWLGVFLDTPDVSAADWDEIAAILQDAYRLSAPKHLLAKFDAEESPG
jgi:hypothetical protein